MPARVIRQQRDGAVGHAVHIAHGRQHAVDAVPHHLRETARARPHDRHAGGQRLERRETERLRPRGQQVEIGPAQHVGHVLDRADETDLGRHAQVLRLLLRRDAVGAVAGQHEARGQLLVHQGEDPHHIEQPLDRAHVGDVHQHLLLLRPALGIGPELLEVHEVRHDVNAAGGAAEGAVRLLLEVRRHGGHGVRVLDGELGDGEEAGVLPHQRDVGAV